MRRQRYFEEGPGGERALAAATGVISIGTLLSSKGDVGRALDAEASGVTLGDLLAASDIYRDDLLVDKEPPTKATSALHMAALSGGNRCNLRLETPLRRLMVRRPHAITGRLRPRTSGRNHRLGDMFRNWAGSYPEDFATRLRPYKECAGASVTKRVGSTLRIFISGYKAIPKQR